MDVSSYTKKESGSDRPVEKPKKDKYNKPDASESVKKEPGSSSAAKNPQTNLEKSGDGEISSTLSSSGRPFNARREKRLKWLLDNQAKRFGNGDFTSPIKFPDADVDKRDTPRQKSNKRFAVFIGQIPFNTKEAEIRALFEKAAEPGKLKEFRWRTDLKSGRFRGFAFAEFENKGAFERAFELHGTLINGRPINVEASSIGGKKNQRRKDLIKDRTTKFRQKAQNRVENRARDAKKNKKNAKPIDDNAESQTEQNKSSSATKRKGMDSDDRPSEINTENSKCEPALEENPKPKKKKFRPFNKE